jgi:branched-chain amino acid aminotransferase
MKIYLNGKFVRQEEARVSVFAPGFLYGQGVFETMRAYNRKILRLDSHIERLFASATYINIAHPVAADVLKEAALGCLKENNLKDAYVRITMWQSETEKANVAVFAKSYNFLSEKDYRKGFKAIISRTFRQNEYSPLSGIKSANYLTLLLAYQEAKRQNADEALLLNTQGMLAEASRANIFLVKDNCLITPSLDSACLPGITRGTVLDIASREKIDAIETKVSPQELWKADEAFLTNSLIEVMPLVSADGKPIHKGTAGKITELIRKRYRSLI